MCLVEKWPDTYIFWAVFRDRALKTDEFLLGFLCIAYGKLSREGEHYKFSGVIWNQNVGLIVENSCDT